MNQITPISTSSPAYSIGKAQRLAIVSAQWHSEIVYQARDAAVAELAAQGWRRDQIDLIAVPGALEIPLVLQRLAASGQYAGLMACALIVNGGIYRHEFVAPAVVDALMRVQLDSGVPVFSVVLTPKDYHEHATHRDFFSRHFVEKGAEAARACHQTLAVHAELDAAADAAVSLTTA